MTNFVIVDDEGQEYTEPVRERDKAEELLEKAEREGTLDYSIRRIGRGFA